nr:MAG TPA_asm: hypothetical protein [Caudoviricetes sp.]
MASLAADQWRIFIPTLTTVEMFMFTSSYLRT